MDKPSFWVAGAIFFAFAFWFTGTPLQPPITSQALLEPYCDPKRVPMPPEVWSRVLTSPYTRRMITLR